MSSEIDPFIEDACSSERLEIHLTPSSAFRWTLVRLLRCVGSSQERHLPSARLYIPERGVWNAQDAAAQITMLGEREIILNPGSRGLRTALGAKVRNLLPGTYSAELVIIGNHGSARSLGLSSFAASGSNLEWILAPIPLQVPVGSSIALRLLRDGSDCVYESAPLLVRGMQGITLHQYVFGKRGNRVFDCVVAAGCMLILALPYCVLVCLIRHAMVQRFPKVAAQRASGKRSRIGRYLAPAFFHDPSRWVFADGTLRPGHVYKLETLTPIKKRPLLGFVSVLLRVIGADEWPQFLTILRGEWSFFGPRAVPNLDGLVAPDGKTVQHSHDTIGRYEVGGKLRKPGALSLRMAIAQRGCVELPPWRTMLLYDRYDSTHWSVFHATRVIVRFFLSIIWAEAIAEQRGAVERRLACDACTFDKLNSQAVDCQ